MTAPSPIQAAETAPAQWQQLGERYIRMCQTRAAVVSVMQVASPLCAGGWVMTILSGVAPRFVLGAVLVTVVALQFWLMRVRATRTARSWRWQLRADALVLSWGWWSRRQVLVPLARIQIVDLTSGPLERRYGIAQVHLRTSSAGTEAVLPGLARTDAEQLRDQLSAIIAVRGTGER